MLMTTDIVRQQTNELSFISLFCVIILMLYSFILMMGDDAMTHNVEWLVPGRVIEARIFEEASDEVLLALDPELNAMLDTASQPVHILMDVRNMKVYPSAQTTIKLKYYKHPQLGRLLMIGLAANPILRFLSALVGRGMGIQIKDFPSREAAQAYLTMVERV